MKADKEKLAMAMARACMNRADLIIAAKMPENTSGLVRWGALRGSWVLTPPNCLRRRRGRIEW